MARQFYDGYPKIYDRKMEIAENFCDDISDFTGACECEPQKITAMKNANAKTKSTNLSAKKNVKTTANAGTITANVKITPTYAKVCKIRAVRLFKPVQTEFWTGFSKTSPLTI